MMMNGGDGFCIGYDGSGDDRRQKRMIKNRESAARSRARKQAGIKFDQFLIILIFKIFNFFGMFYLRKDMPL